MISIYDLKRNDLEGAIAYFKERGDAMTPERTNMLLTLQDDPTALIAAMMPARADYDPDQPRAANGQFGEGSGSGNSIKNENEKLSGGGGGWSSIKKAHIRAEQDAMSRLKKAGDAAIAAEDAGNKSEAERHWAEANAADDKFQELKAARLRAEVAEARGESPAPAKPPISKEYHQLTAHPDNMRELATRMIVHAEPLGGGANASVLVTLDDGKKAVWKPAEGEATGLRGNVEPGTYYLREAAAANLARHLGVEDLVPAVVAHDGDNHIFHESKTSAAETIEMSGSKGSMHAWVPGEPMYKANNENSEIEFDRDSMERMRVFDYVIGNSDRHYGNILHTQRDGKTMPVLIDHGLAFPKGTPEQFIQPMMNAPRSAQGQGLLPSTHEAIKSFHLESVAEILRDSGIEREATKHVLLRAMNLRKDPDLLMASNHLEKQWNHISRVDLSENSGDNEHAETILGRVYK